MSVISPSQSFLLLLLFSLLILCCFAIPSFSSSSHRERVSSFYNQDLRRCHSYLWPLPRYHQNGTEFLLIDRRNFSLTVTPSDLSYDAGSAKKEAEALELWLSEEFCLFHSIRDHQVKTESTEQCGAHTSDFPDDFYTEGVLDLTPPSCFSELVALPSAPALLSGLTVQLTQFNASLPLTQYTNESYSLTINADPEGAVLKADNIYGALHGIKTFCQLVYGVVLSVDHIPLSSGHMEPTQWMEDRLEEEITLFIAQTPWEIIDEPRFVHRGLLVDTSRHYLEKEMILKTINALSQVKMNVLHWHLTDSQSFPLYLSNIPELALQGAYRRRRLTRVNSSSFDTTLPVWIYNATDVEEIVSYGKRKGVRVIPEIDTPGHSFSWSYAHPEIVTCADIQPNWADFCGGPPCGQLDPTLPSTYSVVKDVLLGISELFQDDNIHLGFDEINFNCWATRPSIVGFLQQQNYTSWNQLVQFYLDNQLEYAFPSKKVPMYWEDVLDMNLIVPINAIVQVWSNTTQYAYYLENASQQLLLSNSDAWYLDCGDGNWVTGGEDWCSYSTWQDVYLNEPFQNITVDPIPSDWLERAIGGEICIWGDKTGNSNLESATWARAAAAAERLWSSREVNSTAEALSRILVQSSRFSEAGIGAGSLTPYWCLYNPASCLDSRTRFER